MRIHPSEGKSMNIDLTKDRAAHERPRDDYDGNIPIKLTKEELRDLSMED